MKNKIAKLLDDRSIIALSATFAFVFMTITGKLTSEQFLTIYTVIALSFFKRDKDDKDKDNKES